MQTQLKSDNLIHGTLFDPKRPQLLQTRMYVAVSVTKLSQLVSCSHNSCNRIIIRAVESQLIIGSHQNSFRGGSFQVIEAEHIPTHNQTAIRKWSSRKQSSNRK